MLLCCFTTFVFSGEIFQITAPPDCVDWEYPILQISPIGSQFLINEKDGFIFPHNFARNMDFLKNIN